MTKDDVPDAFDTEASAVGRQIPFADQEPGEDCAECGATIPADLDPPHCHSCRVRPHEDLVDSIAEDIADASEHHAVRVSIVTAVEKRLFAMREADDGGVER